MLIYENDKELIMLLKNENKELKAQIQRMNDNMNELWREILSLHSRYQIHVCSNTMNIEKKG